MRVQNLAIVQKAQTTMSLYDQTYNLAPMNAEELAIFQDNFNKLLSTQDSVIREILEERANTILMGIMAIKESLERRQFRGMNPGDAEIGMGMIRPEFVKDTNVIINDWNVVLTGMGTWDTWLSNAGDTGGFLMSEDHGLIITHVISEVTPTPFVRALHFEIGRTNLIPEDVTDIILGDNKTQVPVFPVPTKIILPEDEFRLNVTGVAGTEYLKLGGLVIGLGRLLKAETPNW